MNEFGYKKSYKGLKICHSLYPFAGLLGIAAYWFFIVAPGMGDLSGGCRCLPARYLFGLL